LGDSVNFLCLKIVQKETDNREDEIILVEENNDHYDCESDVGELYMPAT
jgi:hypothetical protein